MIDLALNTDGSLENNFTDDPFHLFIQELAVIFSLDETDFYGFPRVLNLKKYVFSKNLSNNQISDEIRKFVIDNCEHSAYMKWDVNTNFIKTPDSRDIVYIIFNIYKNNGEVYTDQFVIGNV